MKSIAVSVDLHVHSTFSGSQTSWFLRTAGASECYTSPRKVYELATSRGMNLVTICDHDEIAGAVQLCAQHANAFISEEVSAKFPSDDCVVHVLALNIDEEKHREIQRLRRNIYDLAGYFEAEQIAHVLCHPLAPVNRRLDESHLKRAFMMFRNVEVRNGTRDVELEQQARRIVEAITPERLQQWAEEHPAAPFINREARYGLTGGSDDHAGLSIARAQTSFTGDCSGDGLAAALRERRTVPGGDTATVDVISHNIYGVIAGVMTSSKSGPVLIAPAKKPSPAMTSVLMRCGQLIGVAGAGMDLAALVRDGHTEAAQEKMHDLLEHVLVTTSRDAIEPLRKALMSAQLVDAAEAVADVLKAALLATPAVMAAHSYAADRRAARELAIPLAGREPRQRPPRVAVLSDTVDETNGVAHGLKRLTAHARAAGLDLRLISVGEGNHVTVDAEGIVRIPAILRHRLKDYPQINFGVPHLPSLLHYLASEDIDLVQCSTPGPVGLAGLAAGRLAAIPVIGQYHTDLPVYAARITGDTVLTDIVSSYVGWFYRGLDRVLAPSGATRQRLIDLGVPADKIRLVPRGIDLELFRPERRDRHTFDSLGLNGEPKVLYVGRISREKGLDTLIEGFASVSQALPTARLLLIGDGPYAAKLAASSSDRVILVGERTGADLARCYASSDIFVFPSETETFGNAVVEAQAAGLPVIVASRGAACENVLDGITGLVVDAQDPNAIGQAIHDLLTHPERRRQMAVAAALHARRFDLPTAVRGTFDLYQRFLADVAGQHAPLAA